MVPVELRALICGDCTERACDGWACLRNVMADKDEEIARLRSVRAVEAAMQQTGTEEPCEDCGFGASLHVSGADDRLRCASCWMVWMRQKQIAAEAAAREVRSVSDHCTRTHEQYCHICDNAECGDNTNPTVVALREEIAAVRAKLALMKERNEPLLAVLLTEYGYPDDAGTDICAFAAKLLHEARADNAGRVERAASSICHHPTGHGGPCRGCEAKARAVLTAVERRAR